MRSRLGGCHINPAILTLGLCLAAVSCAPPPLEASTELIVPPKPSYDITPVRGELRTLGFRMDDEVFACSLCHDGFTGEFGEAALEGQHASISFDHGLNLHCLNCHNPQDSDTFVQHDGSAIPGDMPTQLCAKCHGVHYREWRLGIHGRVNGYWDGTRGERHQVHCIQCHDPHRPHFPPMAPEPPVPLTRFESTVQEGTGHDD